MIEVSLLPVLCGMTVGALAAEGAFMLVVLLMAAVTGGREFLLFRVFLVA